MTSAAVRLWPKAIAFGLLVTVTTYLAAMASAAAQHITAAIVLAWPMFVVLKALPAGEDVTTGSPSNPWPFLASVALAWLIYSLGALIWLRHRSRRLSG